MNRIKFLALTELRIYLEDGCFIPNSWNCMNQDFDCGLWMCRKQNIN